MITIRSTSGNSVASLLTLSHVEMLLGPLPVRRTFEPRAYGGHALQIAAHLDASCPGFLLATFYGSSLKRQAQFAAFSAIDLADPSRFDARLRAVAPAVVAGMERLDPLARIARALILLRAKRIIEVALGSCPTGFLGLMARVGSDPLPKSVYRKAHALYEDPHNKGRAAVLRQLRGTIAPTTIEVVATLDDVLVHRAVVERIKSLGEVAGLHRFVTMIREQADAEDAEIVRSLDALPHARDSSLVGWAEKWVERQVRGAGDAPVSPDDPHLRIRFGADLTRLGREYRNCLSQRLASAFAGESLYAEWIGSPGPGAVLELQPLSLAGGRYWVCEQVVAARNAPPADEVVAAIRAKLDQVGVLYRPRSPGGSGHAEVRRLLDLWPDTTRPGDADACPAGLAGYLSGLDTLGSAAL